MFFFGKRSKICINGSHLLDVNKESVVHQFICFVEHHELQVPEELLCLFAPCELFGSPARRADDEMGSFFELAPLQDRVDTSDQRDAVDGVHRSVERNLLTDLESDLSVRDDHQRVDASGVSEELVENGQREGGCFSRACLRVD